VIPLEHAGASLHVIGREGRSIIAPDLTASERSAWVNPDSETQTSAFPSSTFLSFSLSFFLPSFSSIAAARRRCSYAAAAASDGRSTGRSAFHLPMRYLYANALHHAIRSSDAAVLGGFYLHGEGQVGALHPGTCRVLTLPLDVAMNVDSSPTALAFAGCMRCSGGLPSARRADGRTTFAFSGSTSSIQPRGVIGVVAHIPWVLLASDLCWRRRGQRARITGVALALGRSFCSARPNSSMTLLAVAMLMVCRRSSGAAGLAVLAAAIAGNADRRRSYADDGAGERLRGHVPYEIRMSLLHPQSRAVVGPYTFRSGSSRGS
jgi:hypothetical protein